MKKQMKILQLLLLKSSVLNFLLYKYWKFLKYLRQIKWVLIKKKIETDFTNKSAIFIGMFQVLALIPGVSRSGITITSGRLLGFNRFDSAKVSFLLSIPTLLAASILGIYNIYREASPELNFLAIIAVIFSFIFSYLTIMIFLNFIKKFSLKIFVVYRIIISILILSIVYL